MARGGDNTPLRVLAWPGAGFRAKNPYTWLLYSHLAQLGVTVRDFSPARVLRGGYDLLHIHWPEKALTALPLLGRTGGAGAALGLLEAARRHGAGIVWTAHNARPHEFRDTALERWYWAQVVRRVDGVIHLSETSRAAVEARFPGLARRANAVVPIGHYKNSHPDTMTREEARASFALPVGARVLTFLGLVRPYKNVPHLIRTVRALPPETGVVLLVAGEPLNRELAEEVREAAGDDSRVRLALHHVPEDDVQRYMRAADLVVLPFANITNSSSVLLALSFERPVLVPALGTMGELQDLVGADWVRTYEGELTPAVLTDAVAWINRRPAGVPDLQALDWTTIAEQTLAFYRAVTARASPNA
ncbi:MAG TPA: glycosyltransferase [Gemmatimonadales bacterium]|nr:glycosyltransferase [Gemmatimonadales bacterium]